MQILITGGTGLLGRSLARDRLDRGDQVAIVTRNPESARGMEVLAGAELIEADPTRAGSWLDWVEQVDAVVHLAGENLAAKRWNESVKRSIRDSRVESTRLIAERIARASRPPRVLVQGSATGYYGDRGEEWVDETATGDETGFLGQVCRDWEAAAHPVKAQGVRLVAIRTGMVLARGEGALGAMEPLFRWGPGVPIGGGWGALGPGTGTPWMSWIHLADEVGILNLALDNTDLHGPVNATAPNPVRNREFTRALSGKLWRPLAFWRVALPIGPPAWMLDLVLGEMAQVVLASQRIEPAVALRQGYTYRFPTLAMALDDLYGGADSKARAEGTSRSSD